MEKFTPLTQFTIPVVNALGQLGKIAALFRKNTITLTGLTAEVVGNTSFIRLVTTEKPERVTTILTGNGYAPIQSPVVALELPNKPGELERLTNFLTEEGLNINGVYGTTLPAAEAVSIIVSLDNPTGKTIDYAKTFGKFFGTVAVGA